MASPCAQTIVARQFPEKQAGDVHNAVGQASAACDVRRPARKRCLHARAGRERPGTAPTNPNCGGEQSEPVARHPPGRWSVWRRGGPADGPERPRDGFRCLARARAGGDWGSDARPIRLFTRSPGIGNAGRAVPPRAGDFSWRWLPFRVNRESRLVMAVLSINCRCVQCRARSNRRNRMEAAGHQKPNSAAVA